MEEKEKEMFYKLEIGVLCFSLLSFSFFSLGKMSVITSFGEKVPRAVNRLKIMWYATLTSHYPISAYCPINSGENLSPRHYAAVDKFLCR